MHERGAFPLGASNQALAASPVRCTGVLRRWARSDRRGQQKSSLRLVGWSGKGGVDRGRIFVLAAGLLEVLWAVELKYTDGFTRF
jgi:hypothetical protein